MGKRSFIFTGIVLIYYHYLYLIMTVRVKDRKTGEIKVAVYGPNRLGNMQYHVFENDRDYKSVPDKKFNKRYIICPE